MHKLLESGKSVSCYTPGPGGIAEAVMKQCFGNGFGFEFAENLSVSELFSYRYGAFLLELSAEAEEIPGTLIGIVTEDRNFRLGSEAVSYSKIETLYENRLESVYACNIPKKSAEVRNFSYTAEHRMAPVLKKAQPKVLIPAFPGTNCEYDSAKAVRDAGLSAEIYVINNLSSDGIKRSVEEFAEKIRESQVIFIPGGFSGGDEPDGSGKFITAFFRNEAIKSGVTELLDQRDGLMCGICNGFQALIKLGLVPYGGFWKRMSAVRH